MSNFAGFINPDDMPPEVRAWFEQLAAEAMATFGGQHGTGTPTDGYLVDAINYAIEGEDFDLTDEEVEADHERVTHLHEYVIALMPDPESWNRLTMADKIRAVVTDAYMRMTAQGPGTCVHRDRVQRDLLEIADHLDLTSDFGTKVPTDTRVSGPAAGLTAKVDQWVRKAKAQAYPVCDHEWEGHVTHEHMAGLHYCDRRENHANRHRCRCGVSRVNHG